MGFSVNTDPAPRGGIPEPCPPNENCAPPSEDCASKKLTGLGLLECKSRPKLVFANDTFVVFVDYTGFYDTFGMKTFFWGGDHPISAGKNVWISDFGRKIT